MDTAEALKQKAIDLGFDLVGITDASPIDNEQVEVLADWLVSDYAASMDYMRSNFEKRIDPAKLLQNAQSVICLGLNYNPGISKKSLDDIPAVTGRVACYAQYEDYHPFMKKQLRKLVEFMVTLVGCGLHFKICVDSAPLAERALAARAGLGFIGKNHMLINPVFGSRILLGEIITNLKLPTDLPLKNDCSACDKCMKACPAQALKPDKRFDAGKCISYLTIEHKDSISPELAEKIGDRLFGCDECILACPYQSKAAECRNERFKFYPDRAKLNLQKILQLTDGQFENRFADSPIKRIGLERLKRNARICLENLKSLPQRSRP